MAKARPRRTRLRRISVRNFKVLDKLDLEFPAPKLPGETDIIVLGSRNGLGKTSVLECCALLLLAPELGEDSPLLIGRHSDTPLNLPELLIRSGQEKAMIEGVFEQGENRVEISVSLLRSGKLVVNVKGELKASRSRQGPPPEFLERFMSSLVGLNSEPVINPPLLYFHSYRKILEGNPELRMMVEGEMQYRRPRFRPGYDTPISMFKLLILRSMMGQANLFEKVEEERSREILDRLNTLVEYYAGGKIEKLRPSPDNTFDFRIYPSKGGGSFTFDGLSSGQKEAISTLFLTWYYSSQSPCIILLDEPELHLNAEWHRDFVSRVGDLAPDNQYIIATHSEDIFGSVDQARRVLLLAGFSEQRDT